jgi:hypothetical protein
VLPLIQIKVAIGLDRINWMTDNLGLN